MKLLQAEFKFNQDGTTRVRCTIELRQDCELDLRKEYADQDMVRISNELREIERWFNAGLEGWEVI